MTGQDRQWLLMALEAYEAMLTKQLRNEKQATVREARAALLDEFREVVKRVLPVAK